MNGKCKGSEFERVISKKLSLWLSEGEDDDLFWRTQGSGGRHTQRKKKGKETKNQEGDITSTHPSTQMFSEKICIECKHHKDINLWSIITRTGGQSIYNWYSTLIEISKDSGKIPFLIAKQNNKPILLITNALIERSNYFNDLKPISGFIFEQELSFIYIFEDLLKQDPETFRTFLEKSKHGILNS